MVDLEAVVVALEGEAKAAKEEARASLSVANDTVEHDASTRRAQEAEQLYLRNVLLRYMETEDHTAMFPVVAMCLRLSKEEVSKIRERREERERAKGGAVRRFLFG